MECGPCDDGSGGGGGGGGGGKGGLHATLFLRALDKDAEGTISRSEFVLTAAVNDLIEIEEAELLRSLDPDDLKALLQSLRRFPWEEDAEAQTEHSGDLSAPMDLRAHTPEQLMEKLVEHRECSNDRLGLWLLPQL